MPGAVGNTKFFHLKSRWRESFDDYIIAADWSPNGYSLAVASASGLIWLLDGKTGKQIKAWNAHDQGISQIAWHPDGGFFCSGGEDGWVRAWKNGESKSLWGYKLPKGWVEHLEWSRVSTVLREQSTYSLAVSFGKEISILDQAGNLAFELKSHPKSVMALQWNPHQPLLLTAC